MPFWKRKTRTSPPIYSTEDFALAISRGGDGKEFTLLFVNRSSDALTRITVSAGSFQSYDDEFIEPRGQQLTFERVAGSSVLVIGREGADSFAFFLWWTVSVESARGTAFARFSLEPGFPGRQREQVLPSECGTGWLIEPEDVRITSLTPVIP